MSPQYSVAMNEYSVYPKTIGLGSENYRGKLMAEAMQILTVDVGTGTQDIYLYDLRLEIENGYKLVLPSPTMMIYRRLKEATRKRQPVLLTGFIMGGGPSAWAAEAHARAGLPVYATPQAARSFNDDLEAVQAAGIRIISDDEAAAGLSGDVLHLELRDFDFNIITKTFERFGVSLDRLSAVAVAVFDHGNAPRELSDRKFRFDYLDSRIHAMHRPGLAPTWTQALAAFAYPNGSIPEIMTRLQAVADSANEVDVPLLVMDTAPAAVLGATFDPRLAVHPRLMVANIGNFHTLAFRLGPDGIEGVFEHHSGMLTQPRLETYLESLAAGGLTNDEIFADMGHGALIYQPKPFDLDDLDFGVAVTGPRRNLLLGSHLRPYFSVPFGDMMISGCFGLLAAVAEHFIELGPPIRASFDHSPRMNAAPWDVD